MTACGQSVSQVFDGVKRIFIMAFAFFRVSSADSESANELNRFLAGNSVIRVERHFHAEQSEGYWSFCVEYCRREWHRHWQQFRRRNPSPGGVVKCGDRSSAKCERTSFAEVMPEQFGSSRYSAYGSIRGELHSRSVCLFPPNLRFCRRAFFAGFGSCDPWRQLEQQRAERAGRVSEQERPG